MFIIFSDSGEDGAGAAPPKADEERKEWEAFHLDLVVKETGLLPPHNRNRGKSH